MSFQYAARERPTETRTPSAYPASATCTMRSRCTPTFATIGTSRPRAGNARTGAASLPGAKLSTLGVGRGNRARVVADMPGKERTSCARTLVIPMFREAPRIARTIRALAGSALDAPETEIILVDDGSDDDTVAVAEAALAAVPLAASIVRLERNLGKGGAVRAGVLAARGRAIAFSDADLSVGE